MLLRMDNIVKKYGDLVANDKVNLTLNKGEILAVIGENGAGKTTLMKVLYGLEQPTSGTIVINGEEIQIKDANQAIKNGIGMVQQHFMLFETFNVTENIVYGKEPRKGVFFDLERAKRDVKKISQEYELPLDPERGIAGMPVGLRQRVEILKVLYQNSDIIIFDEPTAVLTPQEVKELLKTLKQLAKMGKSIIIITHKLYEVMSVADRAMVMRAGEVVADVRIEDTTAEELSFLMVGRHLIEQKIPEKEVGQVLLNVEDLCLADEHGSTILKDVNIHVKSGEIVGVAGVSGNGQTELVECLFGLRKAVTGSISLKEKNLFNKSVKFIRKAGISLVPEDRYIWGSAIEATLYESAIMGHYAKPEISSKGMISGKKAIEFTQQIIRDFGVKAETAEQTVGSLSGGNAQKLIVGREIKQDTPLLIVAEPTRGVDVGAMEAIHDKIIEKRMNGDGVLLVSSELSEIIKLSDRIYVMYEGEINGELFKETMDEEEIGVLMAGGRKHAEN